MPDRIRIIPHEAVPKCGSYEVRFSDARKSQYFYWDDIPGRRLRPDLLTSEQALRDEPGKGLIPMGAVFLFSVQN